MFTKCASLAFLALLTLASPPGDAAEPGLSGGERESLGVPLIPIPAGSFEMGSDQGDWDEAPVHKVTISRPFLFAAERVSLAQFQQFRPEHILSSPDGSVIGVAWDDAMAFCAWLSEREGKTVQASHRSGMGVRVPSERKRPRRPTLRVDRGVR